MSGPVYGPVIGGIISEKLSWQWIFWILLILGATSLVLVGLFSPETLRSLVGNGSGYANPTIWQWLARRRGKLDERAIQRIKDGRIRPRMNFLKPFSYLLQPDVFTVLLYNGLHYAAYYCFLSSTTKQFSIHYPYLSELEIGLCFLCQGSGTIIGSFTRGQMLDRDYKKTKDQFKQKHPDKPDSDFPIFKARFKTLWPNIVLCQIVTLFYGWSLYWGAPLAVALVLQFLGTSIDILAHNIAILIFSFLLTVGFGATGIMTTTQTLLIDLHPGKGASITASNNLVRFILG